MMTLIDELERLRDLHESGALTDEEYTRAKTAMIEGGSAGAGCRFEPGQRSSPKPPPLDEFASMAAFGSSGASLTSDRTWAMLLHFSQLAGYVLPVLGMIVPIILWQIKADSSPFIDANGKAVMNWLISSMVYYVIGLVLLLIVIGIPILFAVMMLGIVFPIVGGIKANQGEVWQYPMTIRFLK